ncbi:MAG: CehA/McbA family metallohydrolase, partial [Myxococcota bacterium]
PTALSISMVARRYKDGDRLFALGTVVLHPSGQTPAFSMLRSDLERSRGFVYPPASGLSAPSLMKALVSSDLTILVGGDEMPPISYGLERVKITLRDTESTSALASFGITGRHFTLLNSLTKPLWFERKGKPPGLFQFMQLPFMDLTPTSALSSLSRIWVGERADVASITDQIWPTETTVHGRIDDATARIHIDLTSGAPITEIRPNPDGRFTFQLPAGSYRGRAIGAAGRRAEFEFTVAATTTANPQSKAEPFSLPAISLGSVGWLELPEKFIGRLIFLNALDGNAVVFGDHHLGLRIGEEVIPSGLEAPFLNLANSPLDPKGISLSAGRYRVLATRGPEYEIIESFIEVRVGEPASLEIPPLLRVLATPGWLAADLHVHSGVSFDSNLPQVKQIIAFAASGAEVLVATEHDRIFDPQPAIAESRLTRQLVSITGVEITSAVGGAKSPYQSAHLNAFPVVPALGHFRNGAPSLRRQRLRDSLAEIRGIAPTAFVQLNHPRSALEIPEDDAYFEHLGQMGEPFAPTRPLTDRPNHSLLEVDPNHGLRDLDYHGVELLNAESLLRYRRARADWFALMRQGERIVGTANSDSHRLGEIVGLPRTYVQVADDSLENFNEARFLQSLREGRVYGSTGPILSVHLDQAGLGELHPGSSGLLRIEVEAADWVPVTEWRAYVNGELVHRARISAGGRASLPLVFEEDAFVTVEVQGDPIGLYAEVLPNYIPFAFTNPIFVDVDGNGRFDPPGMSGILPATMTNPDIPD